MKTSFVSRRSFLASISAAAIVPVVGKAASISSGPNKPVSGKPKNGSKHRLPVSGAVLAAQWKKLAETKLTAHVPPGLARQIHKKLLASK